MNIQVLVTCMLAAVCSARTSPDITEFAAVSINSLGVQLYDRLIRSDMSGSSVCISPLSIATTLTMLYAGTRDEERTSFNRMMGYDSIPEGSIHRSFQELVFKMEVRHRMDDIDISMANRIYVQNNVELDEDFVSIIEDNYEGGLTSVDFADDNTRRIINGWVEENTGGYIPELLERNELQADTIMALVNAVYFSGMWRSEFDEDDTIRSAFTRIDGSTAEVDVMRQVSNFRYYKSRSIRSEILELPYGLSDVNDMAMLLVLPEDMAEFESRELSLRYLLSRATRSRKQKVQVGLPRFTVEQKVELKDLLVDMGMPETFSGITSSHGALPLSQVVHQAKLTVTEEGTQAAAATLAALSRGGEEVPVVYFTKPFLYMIYHPDTRSVVFMGKYMGPDA